MKIAIVSPELTISGGGQRQILELALGLERLGHTVDVFCPRSDKNECYPEKISQIHLHSPEMSLRLAPLPAGV